MKALEALRETPIGRALIAYFVDLPRWALLNVLFALALVPSVWFAAMTEDFALALLLSFPPTLVLSAQIRLLGAAAQGNAPYWSLLWEDRGGYLVVLSAWILCVGMGLLLLTPLLYVAVIPALVVLLLAPLAICARVRLRVGLVDTWRNALIIAVRFPVVALGILLLALVAAWGISVSGGALVVALPALWAAIAVYTVDDLVVTLKEERTAA